MDELLKRELTEYTKMLPLEDTYSLKDETIELRNAKIKKTQEYIQMFYSMLNDNECRSILSTLSNMRYSSFKDIKDMDVKLETFVNLFVEYIRKTSIDDSFSKLIDMLMFVTFNYPMTAIGALRTHIAYKYGGEIAGSLADMNTLLGKEKEYYDAISNILSRNFSVDDIKTVNETIRMMESISTPWKLNSTKKILQLFFPKIIKFDDQTSSFIDPAEEPKYTPADDEEFIESYNYFSHIGDVNIYKHGFSEWTEVVPELRTINRKVPNGSDFNVIFEAVATLKSELEVPITEFCYMDGDHNANYRTIMEYNDELFVLYNDHTKSENGYDLIKGYSLINEIHSDPKIFEYEYSTKESPLIKKFDF